MRGRFACKQDPGLAMAAPAHCSQSVFLLNSLSILSECLLLSLWQ